ncbi:MAG: hypothetical protein ABIM30_08280 [candidate division WOR-3 bacterium]
MRNFTKLSHVFMHTLTFEFKIAFFLILPVLSHAQSIGGVFTGSLVNTKNVLVIIPKESTVECVLYHGFGEKVNFKGGFEQNQFVALASKEGRLWKLKGLLKNDSLFVSLSALTEIQTTMLRLTPDISKKEINKAVFDLNHDPLLKGRWVYYKEINNNVKPGKSAEFHHYTFQSDGKLLLSSSRLDKFTRDVKPPDTYWMTSDDKVKITGGETGSGKLEVIIRYAVLSDTLIFHNNNGSKTYYLKSGTKKQKETE